jgi:hypothetical protein
MARPILSFFNYCLERSKALYAGPEALFLLAQASKLVPKNVTPGIHRTLLITSPFTILGLPDMLIRSLDTMKISLLDAFVPLAGQIILRVARIQYHDAGA